MKHFYFILCLVSSAVWGQVDCSLPMSNYTSIDFRTINNNITGIHNASTSITAINEIQNTTYFAPKIILNDGFKATAGSGVLISIGNCPLSNTPIDLFIKDDSADTGIEPNSVSIAWNSPDIWVRNSDDNQLTHQVPIFGQQNFVYVKVQNKSTTSITPTSHIAAQVDLYRSLPSANPDVAEYLMRSLNPRANDNYSFLGTQNITSIPSNGSTILKFSFFPPMPWVPAGGHAINLNFLAKIVSPNDPLSFPETGNINYDVRRNNNCAAKNNIGIGMDYEFNGHFLEKIQINNPKNTTEIFRLELKKEDLETGKPIYEEAEVGIKMDDILYAAWERGGELASNTIETSDLQKQIVVDNQVLIDNIILEPYESGFVDVSFNFLIDELTNKTNFTYHLIQRNVSTNEIVGGQTFIIKKNSIQVFDAEASDKEVDKFEPITLSAEDIGEQALYNWYDSEGNLIFEGKDLFIANAVAEKYKLEVIRLDGFKDYKDVEVSLKPNRIEKLFPNPTATNNVNITYKINEAESAYIMINSYYMTGGISHNYIVNKDETEININLSNYPLGLYKIALVADGVISDMKILSKQ